MLGNVMKISRDAPNFVKIGRLVGHFALDLSMFYCCRRHYLP